MPWVSLGPGDDTVWVEGPEDKPKPKSDPKPKKKGPEEP